MRFGRWTHPRHFLRLPADALAFYRPFHFSPHDEWGIYVTVEKLLDHCQTLYGSFIGKLAAFNLKTVHSP